MRSKPPGAEFSAITRRSSTTPRRPAISPTSAVTPVLRLHCRPGSKAVAILTAAREACGQYVWTVNQPAARNAGLSDADIAAIHEYRAPAGLSGDDAVVSGFVIELLRQHRVSDATFEALRRLIGDASIVDLLVVVAYYHGLAHSLQALQVELPEGTPDALTY